MSPSCLALLSILVSPKLVLLSLVSVLLLLACTDEHTRESVKIQAKESLGILHAVRTRLQLALTNTPHFL